MAYQKALRHLDSYLRIVFFPDVCDGSVSGGKKRSALNKNDSDFMFSFLTSQSQHNLDQIELLRSQFVFHNMNIVQVWYLSLCDKTTQ